MESGRTSMHTSDKQMLGSENPFRERDDIQRR
jgi:hypothetical protein